MTVKIARIYDDSIPEGKRILVDRVWPRGISKAHAQLDEWLKDIAPSTELRQWFNHQDDLFKQFKEKYKKELQDNDEQAQAFNKLKHIIEESHQDVILLYAAKNTKYNQAIVLQELCKK